ncbi:hypothetical protein NBEOAGPD_3350 [Methylobacterium gregans]|uniref:Uncharacterized protein n=1 Tax=Methylobacterium gregans TaxID=374424 RepID=A0AA37HSF5_9HYPH|nr:hypothetical protein [Methylobacterium gregans]MDQ0524104.1 hypothetical protein [Methylobacterium gregans]GJD80113.1 hypothetical protein NBEOAGPD_3350 [Methylobacterium gregans]
MQTTLLLATAAGLVLVAGALLYAGIRIRRARPGEVSPAPEGNPVAAHRLVGTWQGRQGYAFAVALSKTGPGDIPIDGIAVLAPAGARISVQPADDDRWTRPARRHAVRWRAMAGRRETIVQCRLHLPAAAARAGTQVRIRLTGAPVTGNQTIHVTLTIDL